MKKISFTEKEIKALLNALGNTTDYDDVMKSVFIGSLFEINKCIDGENKLRKAIGQKMKDKWSKKTIKNANEKEEYDS